MESFRALCQENQITMQAYSPLEQGLLTGKIRMDYVLDAVNVRNKISWFQPEKRQKVLDMLDGWAPLCEKYGCSTVALVIAWTMAQGMNVICGGRKTKHIADYIAGGDLELSAEDLKAMADDLEKLE